MGLNTSIQKKASEVQNRIWTDRETKAAFLLPRLPARCGLLCPQRINSAEPGRQQAQHSSSVQHSAILFCYKTQTQTSSVSCCQVRAGLRHFPALEKQKRANPNVTKREPNLNVTDQGNRGNGTSWEDTLQLTSTLSRPSLQPYNDFTGMFHCKLQRPY